MSRYQNLQKEINQAETNERAVVQAAKDTMKVFIASQTFTGKELLDMKDDIKAGNHGCSDDKEPRIDLILDRILAYREDS